MEILKGAAVLVAGTVGGWFLRSFFPSYLSEKGKNLATKEDIEEITEKVESVRTQHATSLEHLRLELHSIAHERQTRFLKLHERRVEAIDGLYCRLVRTQSAFFPLTGGIASGEGQDFDTLLENAGSAGNDLLEFFGENRLYFDAEIISGFGAIQRTLNEAWATFAFDRRDQSVPAPQSERERRVAAWQKARELIREEVPRLREQIENRMRALLGDVAERDKSEGETQAAVNCG